MEITKLMEKTVTMAYEHDRDYDNKCQTVIILTGSNNSFMKEQLQKIMDDIDLYGKPIQGIRLNAGVAQITTPFWDGKEYH